MGYENWRNQTSLTKNYTLAIMANEASFNPRKIILIGYLLTKKSNNHMQRTAKSSAHRTSSLCFFLPLM